MSAGCTSLGYFIGLVTDIASCMPDMQDLSVRDTVNFAHFENVSSAEPPSISIVNGSVVWQPVQENRPAHSLTFLLEATSPN